MKKIENRRARYDYDISAVFEGGIVLTGSEVKSLKFANNRPEIVSGFAVIRSGEVWLENVTIPHWGTTNAAYCTDIRRSRKILLHRSEITKISKLVSERGMTIVLMDLHWEDSGKVKVNLGIGRGRSTVDKRHELKKKAIERDLRA